MTQEPSIQPPEARPFPATWYGASLIACVGFLAWLLCAQLIPGIAAVVVIAAREGASALKPESIEQALAPYVPAIVAGGAVVSVLLVLLARQIGWLAPTPTGAPGPLVRILWTLLAVVACIGGSILIAMLLDVLGQEVTEQEILVAAGQATGIWFILAVAVLGPIGEELLFRRFMFSALGLGLGHFAAYAISALLFALAHFHPPAFFLYMWMGICFAFAYERTGSVWGAISVHVANNAWAVLFME